MKSDAPNINQVGPQWGRAAFRRNRSADGPRKANTYYNFKSTGIILCIFYGDVGIFFLNGDFFRLLVDMNLNNLYFLYANKIIWQYFTPVYIHSFEWTWYLELITLPCQLVEKRFISFGNFLFMFNSFACAYFDFSWSF